MNTEPILLAVAAIVFTLALYAALQSRIASNDLEKQMDDYDENSYS